ncbi:MAG: ComEC/Rec2 family competence protein [Alphaproteobacteria bacterium]|nr:ComEC/Rec2 family competence protein [Alphaproteobacteria bacterium]MCB9700091.1 ComEC/Rec2 family competence protein [Alphaproteobacteria bacterium]
MDPTIVTAVATLTGLLLACELPGPSWAWALLLVGLLLVTRGRGLLRLIPAAVVAGVLCGRSVPRGPSLHGPVTLVGVRVGAGGRVADVSVDRVRRPGGDWEASAGRVRVRFPERAPPPGSPVVVSGSAGPVRAGLPGAPDPVRAGRLGGVRTEVRASAVRRLDGDAAAPIDDALDRTGLLRALLFGDTSRCARSALTVLRNTGTTHLLSVSGFHVGVAAAAVVGLARLVLRLVGLVRPQGVPAGAAVLVGVISAWGYVAVAGWPLPAQRAAGALTLAALGRALGRRTEPLPALCLVGLFLAVIDPSAPASASFQLSFSAMLGLILVVPRLTRYVPPDLPWPLPWLIAGLAATLGATLATLPASAWWFQSLPPLAPLANLVATPALGLVGVPCAALAAWAPWPLDQLGGTVGSVVCAVTLRILAFLAVRPLAPAVGPIGALVMLLALLVGLRRPWLGTVVGVGCLVPARFAPAVPRVTFLDVGQGDAALVELPDGQRILVDGGPSETQVAAWLRRSGVRHLDLVVSSHAERDHEGGLPEVLRSVSVDELWATEPSEALRDAADDRGVPIVVTGPTWLSPDPTDDGSANERSIVVALGGVLFTGDIDEDAELRVARRTDPLPVLKVPHHGSRTSSSAALLDAVHPRLAVVSVGRDNPYHHPADDVLGRLADDGVMVVRTDVDGTVVVEVAPDELRVRTRGRDVVLER